MVGTRVFLFANWRYSLCRWCNWRNILWTSWFIASYGYLIKSGGTLECYNSYVLIYIVLFLPFKTQLPLTTQLHFIGGVGTSSCQTFTSSKLTVNGHVNPKDLASNDPNNHRNPPNPPQQRKCMNLGRSWRQNKIRSWAAWNFLGTGVFFLAWDYIYHLERWLNSHVLVYHIPLLKPPFFGGCAIHLFSRWYMFLFLAWVFFDS